MPIRFHCAGCSQPIEVDDSWGGRAVCCPYCRRTITAPTDSQLGDLSAIPVATPLGGPLGSAERTRVAPIESAKPANRIATAAFILSMVSVFCFFATNILMSPHAAEILELQQMAEKGRAFEAYEQLVKAQGGSPPWWLVAAGICTFTVVAASAASVICSIIGLRRPERRGMLLASIVVSGGLLIFLCAGVFTQIAERPVDLSTFV